MQDHHSSLYAHINVPTFPEQEQLKCPRCDSSNTKFCYYNNYNLSQPRHFCKNCKRYWTKGGALRKIPVGGGSRKTTKRSSTAKRPSSSPSPSSTTRTTKSATVQSIPAATSSSSSPVVSAAFDHGGMVDMVNNASFTAVRGPSDVGQFGNLINGLGRNGSNLQLGDFGKSSHNPDSGLGLGSSDRRQFSDLMKRLSRHGSDLLFNSPGSSFR